MKKIIYVFLVLVIIPAAGCKKFVEGYDVSPNSPITVTNPLLLSNSQVALFATACGQLTRQTSMLIQQSAGIELDSKDVNNYDIDEGTNTNEWSVIYTNGLVNLNKLYNQAGTENPYYQGISRILSAMFLGVATDLWGDIPNREALQGLNGAIGFNPKFDAQQTVLADIQSYLDEAIVLLGNPANKNIMLPGDDDLIFGGDPALWIGTAHVLKARYHNRLSKSDPATSALEALSSLAAAKAAGFTSSTQNCMAVFGQNANEYNQWYAFTRVGRPGYIKTCKTMTDMMNAMNDPRLPFYCVADTGGGYNGCAPNMPNTNASEVGPYLATADAPFPLVTFTEAKFIEAEAEFRDGNQASSATAFNEAVIASLMDVTGSANGIYVSANASETAGTITLQKIMTQKYVAMYGQMEAYADWRRTNIPALTPNAKGKVGVIPRRLPTVLEERLYNTNATVISDITLPVWWDQ